MKSAGNDIVALASVNKQRTNQPAFYSKILSASEQQLYHEPEISVMPFENYVWLLWSVKESVYKYLKRTIPDLIFSPTKIIVTHAELPASLIAPSADFEFDGSGNKGNFYQGAVKYDSHTLYFRSVISEAWVATVVNDDDKFEDIFWGVKAIDNSSYKVQSQSARAALVNKLSPFFEGDLRIEKSPVGYPIIVNNKEQIILPASLAHDGCFVAYSFTLEAEYFCD